MISQLARQGNREATLEDRIAKLELGLRQSPVRGGSRPTIFARIRWVHGVSTDGSECQLTDDEGEVLDPVQLGWIDSKTSCVPVTFGDHCYEVEAVGILTRSSVKRTLYRALRYVRVAVSTGSSVPIPALIERVGTIAAPLGYGTILDASGAAIQTTINGSAADNTHTYMHVNAVGNSGARFALPWPLASYYEQDAHRYPLLTWAAMTQGYKPGRFPSFVANSGATAVTTDTAEAVTPPIRIDHGEQFAIDGSLKILANDSSGSTAWAYLLLVNFYLEAFYDGAATFHLRGSIGFTQYSVSRTGASPVTAVSSGSTATNKHVSSGVITPSYGAANTINLDGIYDGSITKIANLTAIITFGTHGNITSISVQATSLLSGYTTVQPAFMVHGGGGPV